MDRDSAGIAVIFEDKILLIHPTNASWKRAMMSIPKGRIDKGESIKKAARREFQEETGLKLDKKLLTEYITLKYGDRYLHYFIVKIDSLSELGMDKYSIDKKLLQKEEVDWGGFITVKDAYMKMIRRQLPILDKIKDGTYMTYIKEYYSMKQF